MVVLFLPVIAIVALMIGSIVFVLRRGRLNSFVESADQLERERLLRQLAELEESAATELMDSAARIDEKSRLERALVEVLDAPASGSLVTPDGSAGSKFVTVLLTLCIALGLPVVGISLFLYLRLPFLSDLEENGGRLPTVAERPVVDAAKIDEMVAGLAARLESAPEDGEGWKRLGRSYQVLGRLEKAVDAYIQADKRLDNDPDLVLAFDQIVQARGPADPAIEAGVRVQAALAELSDYLQTNPDDLAAWLRLARWQAALGDVRSAQQSYGVAHELVPEQVDVLGRYAAAGFAVNPQPGQADTLALYQKLDRLDKDNPDALWYLGLWRYGVKDYPGAVIRWQALLALMPDNDPAREAIEKALATAAEAQQASQTPVAGAVD